MIRQRIGLICGWLSAAFSGLFIFAVILFLAGVIDLREDREPAFMAFFLTAPPVLILSILSVILLGPRKAVIAWIALCPYLLFVILGELALFRIKDG